MVEFGTLAAAHGFVQVNNLLNNPYETFGTFAPNARRRVPG